MSHKTAFELMLESEAEEQPRLTETKSPLPGSAIQDISVLLISRPLEELLLRESASRGITPNDLIVLAVRSLVGSSGTGKT